MGSVGDIESDLVLGFAVISLPLPPVLDILVPSGCELGPHPPMGLEYLAHCELQVLPGRPRFDHFIILMTHSLQNIFSFNSYYYSGMKGHLSVSPTFEPLPVPKCKIVSMDPLLFFDDKHLYNASGKSIPWESKDIIDITHSKLHGIILILCEDWKVYVLTENLEVLTKMRWDSKYTVCFKLIEEIKALLMIGVGEVHLAYIDLKCNCKQTKFLSSMKCEIIVKDQSPSAYGDAYKHQWSLSVEESTKLKWHKGYEVFPSENLLLVWSLQDINFYRLKTLQTLSHVQTITKKQIPISRVSYNILYRYTIIGYTNGTVRVWKIPLNSYEKKQLIHTFEFHTKPIVGIIPSSDPRVFITQSVDCKVCLWNIDTFEMVYTYDFSEECNKLFLYDYRIFYGEDENSMLRGAFGVSLELITNINSNIMFVDKNYNRIELDHSVSEQSEIMDVEFTLSSNLGVKLNLQDLSKTDVNKSNLQYFYPPLKSKNILQIVASPFEQNKFYYLVENGEIYRTRIEGTLAKIQALHNVSNILTSEIASIIKFLQILPPKFDSETIGRYSEESNSLDSLSYEEKNALFRQKQLLAVGGSKGSVIFLEKQNMNKAYVRISYHRQRVIILDSLYHQQSKKHFLLSMCEQNLLKMVTFEGDKSSCVYSISCQKGINRLICHQDYVFCTFPKGVFQVFKTCDQGQLWHIFNQQATDHDDEIVSIDLDKKHHLIMTASLDQRIKIWNYSKVHILTITIKENLHSAYFTNDLNLLIFNENKLSLLRNNRIQISKTNVQNWKRDEDQQTLLHTFGEYLESIKKKEGKAIKNYRIRSISREDRGHNREEREERRKKTNMSLVIESEDKRQSLSKVEGLKIKKKEQKEKSKSFNEDVQLLNKHLEDMNLIRKTNLEHVPRVVETKESLFDQFMRMKLLNKKILTRRDITLNRIIMKNIVKEYLGNDMIEGLSGMKAP